MAFHVNQLDIWSNINYKMFLCVRVVKLSNL